uniref:Uncharacterized protein n=1 Tax=Anguilla anguilla TaxID=7936 RepID=A0A0E9V981_ANGAN
MQSEDISITNASVIHAQSDVITNTVLTGGALTHSSLASYPDIRSDRIIITATNRKGS